MQAAHETILIAGVLVVLAILAALLGARVKTPLLLVFLGLGMLAGEDGPGGIQFDDFRLTYLLGRVALVVILFEGGLKTSTAMIRAAGWPALALATVGTAVTAGIVGVATVGLVGGGLADGVAAGGDHGADGCGGGGFGVADERARVAASGGCGAGDRERVE
jgi:cell volume regulation protein A